MLNPATLAEYCASFAGYGRWTAPVWFVGIEEAGGRAEADLSKRLDEWQSRGRKDLEDAPVFYPEAGDPRWHKDPITHQPTWTQLIRMLLIARGESDNPQALLDYQRHHLGAANGRTCLLELLPLPSPNTSTWLYRPWSKLDWLQSREEYEQHIILPRACLLARQLEKYRPSTVIFYGSTWHRVWSAIAGGCWRQAINRKLMVLDRDKTTFFVTKHPADPKLYPNRDDYFRQIGRYFRDHAFAQIPLQQEPQSSGA